MKVVVNMSHPSHVHYFKNLITELKRNGHEVLITASEKEVTFNLLDKYSLDYVKVGKYSDSLIKKLLDIPLIDLRVYKAIKNFDPDIVIGENSVSAAHASFLLRKKCINFEDSEHAKEIMMLYMPFVNTVCTPSSFNLNLGRKQIRFDGQKELAYLHPNYFNPNPDVLKEIGLGEDDTIIFLRFVSWTASHDVGEHGIRNRKDLVRKLNKFGKVLISSEGKLEAELERYRINVSPEKIHDLLYYSTIYIGEGATMASEAAVLGTHSIYISTCAKQCGVFKDLYKYELLWYYDDETEVIDRVREILRNNPKEEGKCKRKILLADKIDVTGFMYWFIVNYPESSRTVKENPGIQKRFKLNNSL
jgi:uncharacterized protein